jgi:Protein of unknown function (DUF3800)
MAVRFFYVDESYDARKFCLSAISIRYSDWHESFELVRDNRRALKKQHGLYIRREIHARDLVSGRGNIADRVIRKYDRSRIFHGLLKIVASLPHAWLFNVCLDINPSEDTEIKAWDRLLNRIERTMREAERRLGIPIPYLRPRAMIFADEGKATQITRAFRKRAVYNPIPSRHGRWPEGATRNIPLERIVEDPIFRQSHQSFFIQLADCAAFALLKRESPLVSKAASKYGLPDFFEECLSKVCFRPASPGDKLGVVRA